MDGLVRQGRLMAAVSALMEAPSVLFKDKINFKQPGGAGFEPHQDQQAGWSVYAPLFLTAMISIDRATEENGCLQIARMPRPRAILGEEWKPLTESDLGGHKLVSVPTEPGDVIFFDSFVAHASEPNRSDTQRRILYLTYNRLADGDHRVRYFHDKRQSFPPDVEREPGREYKYRV
jgi:ectoine hydroxylase-related dioxygenase (phytanoyl-CoA dioxygenase family)